jgi:hypothetical protein
MKSRYRFLRKSYALNRMAQAIERAMRATSAKEQDRAARWAAAWGLLCGIKNLPVKLRPSDVVQLLGQPGWPSSEQDEMAFADIETTQAVALDAIALGCQLQGTTPAPGNREVAAGTFETSNSG